MKFKYELHQLSDTFFQDYPSSDYPELIRNREQSYILIDTNTNFLISIPFRTQINHKNAFLFSTSERSGQSKSGLDYSKIVIIQNQDYIDEIEPAIVDEDEFNETQQNIRKIEQDSCTYVDTYIHHVSGLVQLHPSEYRRCYLYSTLPYFNDILFASQSESVNVLKVSPKTSTDTFKMKRLSMKMANV